MRYFIYCRKSSEEEERQALSIESQLTELRDYAKKNNLTVIGEYIESKSAKIPGRTVFNTMLDAIEAGKADGIIAWHPDRISRNSVDGGKVIYMLDQGLVQDLKFPTYFFDSSPHGKFNLSIAFGYSKLYVDSLIQNINRGIREKVRRGEFPGKAPPGYYNHPKTRTIVIDPATFDKVKSLLELFATGAYSLTEMREKFFEHGFRSSRSDRFHLQTTKNILENPFYYGVFPLKGELHQGSHQPMITKELYDKIQSIIRDKGKGKYKSNKKTNNLIFVGFAKCGECGSAITAEEHVRSRKRFGYYRCTKKNRTVNCDQRYTREELFIDQVKQITASMSLSEAWRDKSNKQLEDWVAEERQASLNELANLELQLQNIKDKLNRLLDLQLDGLIEADEYKEKKALFINQKIDLEAQIYKLKDQGSTWLEQAKTFINQAHQADLIRQGDDLVTIKNFLKSTGSNMILQNKNLSVTSLRPWSFLMKFNRFRAQCSPDEPRQIYDLGSRCHRGGWGDKESQSREGLATAEGTDLSTEALEVLNTEWWTRKDSNLRPPRCKRGALPTKLRAHKN